MTLISETKESVIKSVIIKQKEFFNTNTSKDINYRINQLLTLKRAVLKYQHQIEEALWEDLHKSPEEAYLTEISIVLNEINYHLKHLKKWVKPKRVSTPIHLFPSRSKIISEPLGVSLIIAPWNYPFQLLINTLIGSISAGCCTILKPSPSTPKVARVIEQMVTEFFEPTYLAVIQGGKETNTLLLKHKFDIIFFTGSSRVGKIVMKAAAENLTPVILELGGKSPCIVDKEANLDIAAKRIAWGKLINAGQTCIAPDYLLVHESVKEKLLDKIEASIKKMYGTDLKSSRFYSRIVDETAFDRLCELLKDGNIRFGGTVNRKELFIEPTVIENVKPQDEIMQQEIFGPILPVISFSDIEKAYSLINQNQKPLALYYFGNEDKGNIALSKTSSGGACINDTIMHIANHNLPFGGVGNSGLGKYHGKESFLAFSNSRAVITTPTWIDLPMKYVPYKFFNLTKKIV
ncbi:MAG: aldehyde dehydrogenase [Salibacteraceae bacterium]